MKLVLAMIVKDESASIAKTIASVSSAVDHILILDTGSTDGTQGLSVLAAAQAKIPLTLVEEPFVDFSTTRNRAVELAEEHGDYVLMLSGDETLEHGDKLRSFITENPSAPAFTLIFLMGAEEHPSVRVSRTGSAWRYVEPVHEVMMGLGESRPVPPPVRIIHDTSRRSRESCIPRWEKDVEILKKRLQERPGDPRSMFYLAQSYEMLHRYQDALEWYGRRVKAGGWRVEVYSSLYRMAKIRQELKHPWEIVQGAFLEAWQAWPARAEPLYHIGQYWRNQEKHDLAYLFLSLAAKIPYPSELGLDKTPNLYYEIQNCLGVAASYAGNSHEGALGAQIFFEGEAAVLKALETHPHDNILRGNLAFYERRRGVVPSRRNGVTVAVVLRPGNMHACAFNEVAESVTYGIQRLGHEAELIKSHEIPQDRPAIVFGGNLLPWCPTFQVPAGSVIFNLEQGGTHWFDQTYLDLLRRFTVWDYSASNVKWLSAHGIEAKLVSVGHTPELERNTLWKPQADRDIDVLFVGAMNERRNRVISAIRSRGLNVVVLEGVWGTDRDVQMARAKVILNMHYFDEVQVLEEVRLSYTLMNFSCVVSEHSQRPEEDAAFSSAVAFTTYDGLVEECARLVSDHEQREKMSWAGLRFMRRRPVTKWLRGPLADLLGS